MSNFKQFTFSECMNSRSLGALPECLRIKRNCSSEVLLLRLLSGTLDFKNTINNIEISQRNNYTLTDFSSNSRISAKLLKDIFVIDGAKIKKTKIEEYYGRAHHRGNNTFFENLLLEFCNYFYQTKRENNAMAFLHLYRSTELISYCFPLHFAAKTKSYKSSYNSLKGFFTKVDGELSFFINFVNEHLFKSNPILDIDLDIIISQPNTELQEQYYRALKKLCDKNSKIITKSETFPTQIVISRRGLTRLIIDLRNRYFHLLSGDYNDNFSSSDLAEVDLFYKNVNDIILNWLALVYVELLINTIE
jgi:hypothetical protein